MNKTINIIQHTARAATVLLLALLTAQTAWAGTTNPHVEILSGPTYSSDGGKTITLRLWVWNYDGDNAHYVQSPVLYIDNVPTSVSLGHMWNTLLTTNEDNIKSLQISGNVGSSTTITMQDTNCGTAQLKNLQKDQSSGTDQGAMKQARLAIYPEYRTLIYLLNAFCATSDEPERYAALIRALNDNIDYTRRHAMHRKQKSDEPQPDGGDKE